MLWTQKTNWRMRKYHFRYKESLSQALKAASSSSIGSSVAVSSASSSFSFLGACSPSVPSAFLCQTTRGLINSSVHRWTPQLGK